MGALSGASILIIGASHLSTPGYLGTTLNDALLSKGAQVHSLGVCGSIPSEWTRESRGNCGGAERVGSGPLKLKIGSSAHTVPIEELIQTEKPNLLIFVAGDTLGDYQKPSLNLQWVNSEITVFNKIVARSKVKCAWVGPAWGEEGNSSGKTYARVSQVSELLSKSLRSCSYIDSLKMSKPGEWKTIDGIHYQDQYYKQWGNKIAEEIAKLE